MKLKSTVKGKFTTRGKTFWMLGSALTSFLSLFTPIEFTLETFNSEVSNTMTMKSFS